MSFVCLIEIHLHFPENHSLKGKRKEVSSLKAHLHQRFGAAVSETDHHDLWQRATLSSPISKATWVQWLYPWDATPGSHRIEVRSIDGTGEIQTEARSAPAPDGARGHHSIQVAVT